MTQDTRTPPPYISHRTFLNTLEKFGEDPPPVIDDSVLSNLSGGYRPQVVATLKAVGLIDEKRVPTTDLARYAANPTQRKEILTTLWERTYAQIYAQLDIQKATVGQLDNAFKDIFGVEGETRRKAITFFVHGSQYNDMPLSPLISSKAKRAPATRRTPKKKDEGEGAPPAPPMVNPLGAAVTVHPMLVGAIQWLSENGPQWTDVQAKMWCDNFVNSVKLVYPAEVYRFSIEPKPDSRDGDPDEMTIDDFGKNA